MAKLPKKSEVSSDIPPVESGGETDPNIGAFGSAVAARSNAGRKSNASKEAEAAKKELLDQLYSAEICGDILCSISDARFAATGHPVFNIPQQKRASLGTKGALVCKVFLGEKDPKWIAVGMLVFEFAQMSINQEVVYRQWMKEQKLKNQEAAATANPKPE